MRDIPSVVDFEKSTLKSDPRIACFGTVTAVYPARVTPYYLSLIDPQDFDDPIAKMVVPDVRELTLTSFTSSDPLHEAQETPVSRLVHRYRDRALVLATYYCAVVCRFCTRKRIVAKNPETISDEELGRIVEYLWNHPDIQDVIVSGGDPLTLSDDRLEYILRTLRSVDSVELLRIGTRVPVVWPNRVTDRLVSMVKQFSPIYINTHFNHPKELTAEAIGACAKFIDTGIPVNNQSVLLAGVNDNYYTMEQLVRGLVKARIRPYYLYQCDLVQGVEHLRTPLQRGLDIMDFLRGNVDGLAIPTFVVEGPQGLGKLPLLPDYLVAVNGKETCLRNWRGETGIYYDP